MSDGEEYRFVCSGCGEAVTVNAAVRDSITEHGCVFCGSAVTADSFTSI